MKPLFATFHTRAAALTLAAVAMSTAGTLAAQSYSPYYLYGSDPTGGFYDQFLLDRNWDTQAQPQFDAQEQLRLQQQQF